MVSAPVASPAVVGANATCNWQSLFAGKEVVPQALLASTNGPVTAMLLIATAVPPLFSAEIDTGLDVEPTGVLALSNWSKLITVGLRFTAPGLSPVPVSAAVRAPPATLAGTDSCPVRLPACVGRKVTWMVQLVPKLKVAFAQSSVSLKSPVIAAVPGTSAKAPVLVKVTVCGRLLIPNPWFPKSSEAGIRVAVVNCDPGVARGICQTPRPNVAAARTLGVVVAGAALKPTTGALGSPLPNGDQQPVRLTQAVTLPVIYTPASRAM